MDAAVCNFLHAGDKAVVIRGGKFGERWGKICRGLRHECVFVDVEWGKGVDPKAVAEAIEDNPGVRAVYATACETSTATKHDVEAIAKVVKEKRTSSSASTRSPRSASTTCRSTSGASTSWSSARRRR